MDEITHPTYPLSDGSELKFLHQKTLGESSPSSYVLILRQKDGLQSKRVSEHPAMSIAPLEIVNDYCRENSLTLISC